MESPGLRCTCAAHASRGGCAGFLEGETGLHLVVADIPPFVLDVDTRSVTPVSDVPAMNGGFLSVVGVAGRAAVAVAQFAPDAEPELYGVRGREAQVSSLGSGRGVTPANDGQAVWVQSFFDRSHCTLRQANSSRCSTRQLAPSGGCDGRASSPGSTSPQSTQAAASSPSHSQIPPGRGPKQALDVWLLDTQTGALTELPGMPTLVSLKSTSMAWTHDGQLVPILYPSEPISPDRACSDMA